MKWLALLLVICLPIGSEAASFNDLSDATPVTTDKVVGIDDPTGTWGLRLFTVDDILSLMSSDYLSDVGSVAMLDEAETITGNWVNTTNPWADNEVSDTITVGASGAVNVDALPTSGTWDASGLDLTLPNTAYDPTPASDDSWQGAIMTVTAGESVSQWDVVYLKYDTDGPRAYQYNADSTDGDNDTYMPFGIAIEAGTVGNTFDIGIGFGVARNDGWSFTDATDEGKPVYCSEAAAGGIELTAPADSGDHVISIGNLIDEDEILFTLSGFYDEVL